MIVRFMYRRGETWVHARDLIEEIRASAAAVSSHATGDALDLVADEIEDGVRRFRRGDRD